MMTEVVKVSVIGKHFRAMTSLITCDDDSGSESISHHMKAFPGRTRHNREGGRMLGSGCDWQSDYPPHLTNYVQLAHLLNCI